MGCGRCVQSLNILDAQLNAVDTNSVDTVINGSDISSNVIVDGQGIEVGASGVSIELDPNPCNTLTKSAAGLLASNNIVSLTNINDVIVNYTINATLPTVTPYTTINTYTNNSSCKQVVLYQIRTSINVVTASIPFLGNANIDVQLSGGADTASYATEGTNYSSSTGGAQFIGSVGSMISTYKLLPGETCTLQARLTTGVLVGSLNTTGTMEILKLKRLVFKSEG